MNQANWPEWWSWELEFTPHLERRMSDRHFDEIDLRTMLSVATAFRRGAVEDRWIIATRHNSNAWEVVVEPDAQDRSLVLVTAYRVEA